MLEYCNRAVDPLPLTWSAFDIAGRDEMTSGPPQGFSESIMSHAPPVLAVCVVLLAVHTACVYAASTTETFDGKLASLNKVDTHKIVMDLVSIANSIIMSTSFTLVLMELSTDSMSRLGGRSMVSNFGLTWILGVTVYETVIYGVSRETRLEVWAHHVVVTFFVALCLTTGTLHYYQSWGGIVEGTNVFLCTLTIKKRLGLEIGTVLGVSFWASFLILRVISLPWLVYSLLNDWSTNITFVNQIEPMWRCGCLGGCGFIWALSCFWFVSLTKGMMKVLRGDGNKKDKQK